MAMFFSYGMSCCTERSEYAMCAERAFYDRKRANAPIDRSTKHVIRTRGLRIGKSTCIYKYRRGYESDMVRLRRTRMDMGPQRMRADH